MCVCACVKLFVDMPVYECNASVNRMILDSTILPAFISCLHFLSFDYSRFFYLHSLSHNHPFYFIFQIIFSAFPLIVVLIFRHRYFVTFVPIISHLLKFLCLFFLYYYLLLLLFFINCGSHCCSCLVIVFLVVAYSLLLPFLYTAIRRFQHPFSIIQAGHWHL